MKIVISSGHGKLVRGASGYLDEVDEARKVVAQVHKFLTSVGVNTIEFHDDVSKSQNENLNRIVDFHNSQERDLDISVHFNAFETTGAPMGTECLYVTQDALAQKVAGEIALFSGLKNRGPKKRTDLFFLNKTGKPAILIEVCFVDSTADAGLYNNGFEGICTAIAEAVSGEVVELPATTPPGQVAPPEIEDPAKILTFIEPVFIWNLLNGSYVQFVSDLDICNDGSGEAHGDPHHQPMTAYYNNGKYLNADEDRYIVIPPVVRELLKPRKVMGCQGRLTNLITGAWTAAVCGEIGPDDKTGEAAYCAAKSVNQDVSYNSGDKERQYLYEIWPDIPATVAGRMYELE